MVRLTESPFVYELTVILFFLWVAAMAVAIWSLRVAQRFAGRLPEHARIPLEPVNLRVAVILPIKGIDEDTPDNIRALLNQDYPNYRLIFAVEAEDDPAVALIEKLSANLPARGPRKVDIVVAGLAEHRGQKVHNQLAAVERTDDADEILAFMDADARPGPDWLHALVVPLTFGDHIGASTGYRFYVPQNANPASSIVSVINAGVAAVLGPSRRTFAWGGSMAMRRRDFFECGIHSAWQNALSDDYVVSHYIRKVAQKKIHFVARCMVASAADFNFGSLFEFAVRQYRITRICEPLVWLAAFTGPVIYLVSFLYTLGRAIQSSVLPNIVYQRHYEPLIAAGMFVTLYAATILRGYLILAGAKKLLPAHYPAIRRASFWMTFGYPLVQAANLMALGAAAFGRTIVWRGVSYRMLSRTRTLVDRPVHIGAPGPREPELQAAERP